MLRLAANALSDKRFLGTHAGEAFALSQGGLECRPIIRVPVLGLEPDNPAVLRGGADADLATKLAVLMNFPFRATLHLRSVPTIGLAVIGPPVGKDPARDCH